MKGSSCFWTAMLWAVTLCADPAAHVPAAADAALFVRAAQIKAHPALTRLADSGELSRFEKPIRELGVTPDAYVVAFFGLDTRVILADAPDRDTVFAALAARYQGNQSFSVESHSIHGRPAVTKIFYLPPRKPYHSLFEAVWLDDGCVAFGDDDYPLPHKDLQPAANGLSPMLSASGTLAAAFIPDPGRFGFDVMGLSKAFHNVRIEAKENGSGIMLTGTAEAHNPEKLPQTIAMFRGAVQILCVALFGDDETLCQHLMRKFSIKANQKKLLLSMELDAQTLVAIQNYYDGHADRIRHTLEKNVRKIK